MWCRHTNYSYLVFTENTNLTTTPIKFAMPPFGESGTNSVVWQNGFAETSAAISRISTPPAGHLFLRWLACGFRRLRGIYRMIMVWTPPSTRGIIDGSERQSSRKDFHKTLIDGTPVKLIRSALPMPRIRAPPVLPQAAMFLDGNQLATLVPTSPSPGPVSMAILRSYSRQLPQCQNWRFNPRIRSTNPAGVPGCRQAGDAAKGLYYLPEQSLDIYDGLNARARGRWKSRTTVSGPPIPCRCS